MSHLRMPPEITQTTPPQPETVPSRSRAFLCLLLNVIVFPGLGTLASGEQKRKRTGAFQLGLGILLIPILVVVSLGGVLVGGYNPDTVKAWLGNFMLLLVLWNMMTGIQIFRDAWKKAREAGQSAKPTPVIEAGLSAQPAPVKAARSTPPT